MKQIKFNYLLIVLSLLIVFQSCNKEKLARAHIATAGTGLSVKLTAGLYVLNHGGSKTSASLTFYEFNSKKLYPDLYDSVNNSSMAMRGVDMEIYGSKLYCTTDTDLYVVSAQTGQLIAKDVSISWGGVGRVAFYKNNLFFNTYIIDSTALSINENNHIPYGYFPRGSESSTFVVNNKLYQVVEESSYGGYDSLVVINLPNLALIKKLPLPGHVFSATADNYGNLYFKGLLDSLADPYDDNLASFISVINYTADTIKSNLGAKSNKSQIFAQGDFVYYPTIDNKIAVYNAKTQTAVRDNFITDGTLLTSPSAIAGNSVTGEIFITDVKDRVSNGMLYAFDNTGKLEYSFVTGINPERIVLLK